MDTPKAQRKGGEESQILHHKDALPSDLGTALSELVRAEKT